MINKIISISILSLICLSSFAQKITSKHQSQPLSNSEYTTIIQNQECDYKNYYSGIDRLKNFPFNKYKKIVLISFTDPDPKADTVIIDSTNKNNLIEAETVGYFPVKNRKFYPEKAKESIILSQTQINELTDVLYNYGYRKTSKIIIETRSACYNPRNAILFFDEKGNVAEFIEICFECRDFRFSSDKIRMGIFCENKYDLIRKFFSSVGIKYGTN